MTGKSERAEIDRAEHGKALHKARDEFLRLYYSPKSNMHIIGTKELLCMLITQNLEILDLLRNGKSENLNSKTNVNLTNIDKTLHQPEE